MERFEPAGQMPTLLGYARTRRVREGLVVVRRSFRTWVEGPCGEAIPRYSERNSRLLSPIYAFGEWVTEEALCRRDDLWSEPAP